jgi:hypothetical protein
MMSGVTAAPARMQIMCAGCRAWFITTRVDTVFCSGRCRTAHWRASRERPWATVTWYTNPRSNEIHARWTYHPTEQRAQRVGRFAVLVLPFAARGAPRVSTEWTPTAMSHTRTRPGFRLHGDGGAATSEPHPAGRDEREPGTSTRVRRWDGRPTPIDAARNRPPFSVISGDRSRPDPN